MKKIPFTRLKVAQIDHQTLPLTTRYYCGDNPAFTSKLDEIICHADIFQDQINEEGEHLTPGALNALTDLNKQFISFDYIMII